MADKGNDPAVIWQTMLGEMEKGFNSFANQAMTSPEFSKAIEAKQIAQQAAEQMNYTLQKEQKEAERKVIEARGRANAIDVINLALAKNPNYIKYLYVDKLSDKVDVIVSDQSTIMDLKGILGSRQK